MSEHTRELACDVAIVGGGPAGLSAARALRAAGAGRVVVIERESELGGIPRHCFHAGYGLRDLRRSLSGPVYARRLADLALGAGVEAEVSATATNWGLAGALQVTAPDGLTLVSPRAVVLATGTRERPRSARLVPGDRAAGVYTTGQLQQAVYLRHQRVGTSAVIVGAELVSHSALLTLAHAGVNVVAMVTDQPRVQTFGLINRALGLRVHHELITGTVIASVVGTAGRVSGVELADGRRLACDTVVFTGDWIPDHELARNGGLEMNPRSKAPIIDTAARSSRLGVFAIGNLVHPVETADICALDGFAVVKSVVDYLDHGVQPGALIDIIAADGVAWVSPGRIRIGVMAPHGRFTVWPDVAKRSARVVVRQGDRLIGTKRLLDVVPGRPVGLGADWQRAVDPEGERVEISVC